MSSINIKNNQRKCFLPDKILEFATTTKNKNTEKEHEQMRRTKEDEKFQCEYGFIVLCINHSHGHSSK